MPTSILDSESHPVSNAVFYRFQHATHKENGAFIVSSHTLHHHHLQWYFSLEIILVVNKINLQAG